VGFLVIGQIAGISPSAMTLLSRKECRGTQKCREKDSSITKLISDAQRVGLDDYEKTKKLI
jgi:hypothetical protein